MAVDLNEYWKKNRDDIRKLSDDDLVKFVDEVKSRLAQEPLTTFNSLELHIMYIIAEMDRTNRLMGDRDTPQPDIPTAPEVTE